MWTLIGRFGMSLFLNEDSSFFFMRFFVKVTDPLLGWFKPITPAFSSPATAALCSMVHLYDPLLCYTFEFGVWGDGRTITTT